MTPWLRVLGIDIGDGIELKPCQLGRLLLRIFTHTIHLASKLMLHPIHGRSSRKVKISGRSASPRPIGSWWPTPRAAIRMGSPGRLVPNGDCEMRFQ